MSEPEEKKLKWTDLKIGDVIRSKVSGVELLVTGIDRRDSPKHVRLDDWISDSELKSYWEKVEE